MSKLNILRNAYKSSLLLRSSREKHGIPLIFRGMPRSFSTETQQPNLDSTVNSFVQTHHNGCVYGRLIGNTRQTLKSDVINLLEGCKLTNDDVRFVYNNLFMPVAMLVQFHSHYAYDNAFKVMARKGRLFKLERADRSEWDTQTPYDGKYVLLQGVPRNAAADDVDRFLCGCDYDASSIQFMMKAALPDSEKLALIRFDSPIQAMNAYIQKNREFCQNNQINVRVLQ